jgi:hypothetical protein
MSQSIKLRALDARLVRLSKADGVWHEDVDTLAEADGVRFLCPKCYAANGGPVGTHSVICWFVGRVPDDMIPGPGRWVPSGHDVDDLTFVGPNAASVALSGSCAWHGFIRRGEATLS